MTVKKSDYIKAAVTVPDAIRLYCPELKILHGRVPCPLHNGNDYNMTVRDGFYKCHVCGKGGDVINFVMELHGLDFRAALRRIDSDFKLNLFRYKPIGQIEQLAKNI